MRSNHSGLERQQQVKVVIRLKPQESQNSYNKCVSLSEQENQLVVSSDNKQEIFLFDHVAHPATTQLDIYRMIGQEAVQVSLQGFNCCIFAYGQTGAGKTYSIMGDISQLNNDSHCEARGILPRLIQDIFEKIAYQTESSYRITCSYIQIYNQQIFDLLSTDKRVHLIRQDHRRGVFVEGVIEKKLTSYKQGIEALLDGDKSRKIAFTNMNSQSSRSHTIFTVMIQSQVKEDQVIKVRKSKLNIVDLAGSERVKHTNVEGQRLREGCNINKSLHVLGNVINSLVQSTKKKKHIPYRDSKLTYYLKDSLGGNSITKLLANIHCGKEYYGDTISTLMFAKRAKILKNKVEMNQNLSQNFDSLRREVKRLRQELAQARYFKDMQKSQRASFFQDFEKTLQKFTDNSDYEVSPKLQIIQVFEQNQLHYKALIEVYEQHMKTCHNSLKKANQNIAVEYKNNQKKNIALTNLMKQFPAFTKIYKQNILLKQQKDKHKIYDENITLSQDERNMSKKAAEETTFITIRQVQTTSPLASNNFEDVVRVYQTIIDQMKAQFLSVIEVLQKSFTQLEHEVKIKDQKIKSLIKQQDVPADIEQLRNENEYLHLNILKLQNQIEQLKQNQTKMVFELKQFKQSQQRIIFQQNDHQKDEETMNMLLQKLKEIKEQAQRQAQKAEKERQEMQTIIARLSAEMTSLVNQNNKLQLKYTRCGSQKKLTQMKQSQGFLQIQNKTSIDLRDLIEPCPKKFFSLQKQMNQEKINNLDQILNLKSQLKMSQKQTINLKQKFEEQQDRNKKIYEEFGKDLNQLLEEYRQYTKSSIIDPKNVNSINKFREPESNFITSKIQNKLKEKVKHKKYIGDIRTLLQKQTPRNNAKKEVELNHFFSANHTKPKNNINK